MPLPTLGPRFNRIARLAISPWAGGWALANRLGWLPPPEVGTCPYLDAEALARWRELMGKTDVYLEFGSGGSTVEAVQATRQVISVENDRRFLSAVERKVRDLGPLRASFHPVFVNTGWTEKWGRPPLPLASKNRLARWRKYSSTPWQKLEQLQLVPDFIFIDGRFRAASVLESLLRLPAGAECIFMLDDFTRRRAHYERVLPFTSDAQVIGRSLVFRQDRNLNVQACKTALSRAQADPE